MKQDTTPFKCHIFVCLNDRGGDRKSCADGGTPEIRAMLKQGAKDRGFARTDVRVSGSYCLGICAQGPNVIIYPQKILFSGVTPDDIDPILDAVAELIAQ